MTTATALIGETYMTTMTSQEWLMVPDNPRQRDTERRAIKAKHLFVLEAAHTIVHMAEWETGQCKLEGHTRAKIWHDRPDIAPELVDVRVYIVADEDAAKQLYNRFNSREEAEGSADRCFSAMRESGIVPVNSLVREAKFSNAARIAVGFKKGERKGGLYRADVYEAVSEFKAEIVWLDNTGLTKTRMIGPAICCFLMSCRKHGNAVSEFFSFYASDEGVKSGRRRCCVQHFADAMNEANGHGGYEPFVEGCRIGLACIDRWLKSDQVMLTRPPKTEPFDYIR
jgi:hypothetical protein